MLMFLRVIAVAIASIVISVVGTLYALARLRHPSSVGVVARSFGSLHRLVGLKLIMRGRQHAIHPAIYIGNHQNNYDMLTISSMMPPRTVSVGKRSLIWIPFFGLVYWATGNIFIHREKRSSAISTMNKVAEIIKERQVSIWMFPEGTRSRGRGLLPFKTGAFHTAVAAGVPIVPVVCSSLHNKIDLNRWDNGTVICEMLEPVDTTGYNRENIKELMEKCHTLMANKLAELDQEVAQLEQKK
ncbi:1-acylglycerol-3-phosphate O-acyltransferase [Ursidibacter maritimus]|uniref:1-acyl-sn-glycerol-3-phosphate acyltransferase n=1 Tax=Ursidibacter maritimus TaxID=1331689 RepID=A0A949T1N9_9PAST|nr:1-acylglycerol-3-phosphate O-acyltransferase [Ursidibacter maritimus]KAE9542237.1 acyl-phosphate glycerol 3-phosphate acyltransferase [Ursidibacter maritimus]MBV6524513.1 1-acylglycerol-3-phosphate O-acyltransferase [Ursidibacter maritimus]MBV6526238.1 1-acylglycerol-3-phosphate O-acyltransferase [Ursidibacter maritimus]MBV6528317.1 1-acylglycerol-3-phosphate O-acyltransferase [Ursidibacter maritimus]MBV6529643.1 1-acylglycerol-3-phosphate O-acyltransferase [Ursidibacter maritimus]